MLELYFSMLNEYDEVTYKVSKKLLLADFVFLVGKIAFIYPKQLCNLDLQLAPQSFFYCSGS